MFTPNRPLIVGLVSPGVLWLAASAAPGQVARPKGPPTNPASAPASPATYSVLLMANGNVVRGEITDDPAGGVYRLKTAGGQLPFPKAGVKRAGQSIEDLYRYQVASLPPGDADERMRLVQWCLAEHLTAQAREQLAEILKMSPDDPLASRMAANIDAQAEHAGRDLAIRRTAAEVPADAPEPLDHGIVKKLRNGLGNTLPEIFDLPPAAAVDRASHFVTTVQPVLQRNCAGCHNEKYPGEFQLAPVKNSRDRQNPNIGRANLDAALRLVNPDDPSRSDLLAAGLVPHGPNKGAIFRGPNDPQYQTVARWVRSLRPAAATANSGSGRFGGAGLGVTPTGYAPDGFGSDRAGRAAGAEVEADPAPADDRPAAFTPPGARRTVNEINESADFSQGRAGSFPDPYEWAAKEQVRAAASRPATPPRRAASLPAGSAPAPSPVPVEEPAATDPAIAPITAKEVAPGVVAVDPNVSFNELPGMNLPKYPPKPGVEPAAGEAAPEGKVPAGATPPAGAAPAKKKPKVDPAMLEKLMKSRNAGTP